MLVASLLLAVVLPVCVSASIFFSEVESYYNLGDMVSIDITVNPVKEGHLLKTTLVCEGTEILPFNNLPDEEGVVTIKLPLNFHTLDDISGDCYFKSQYVGEREVSEVFKVSKRLEVTLDSDTFFANPGETVTISGSAQRLNGQEAQGVIQLEIPLLTSLETATNSDESNQTVAEHARTYQDKIVEGVFSLTFTLRENTPAGDYRVDALAYELLEDKRSSEGAAIANLKVFQVLSDVEIVISNQNIDPGETLSFKINLLDQTGVPIPQEATVIIKNELGERLFEKIVNSEESVAYKIPTNMTSGNYEIAVITQTLNATKNFFVAQKAAASFDLANQSLLVTNIGNIIYDKDIEIALNGKSFVKRVTLGLSESKKMRLSGENEAYTVLISDGEVDFSRSGVMLTGYSVGVDTPGMLYALGLGTPITWILLCIIVALIIIFIMRERFKTKSYAQHEFRSMPVMNRQTPSTTKVMQPSVMHELPIKQRTSEKAEQVSVLQGHRSKAVVVALKINGGLPAFAKQTLEEGIKKVNAMKGAVYEHDNFVFVIFSQLLTRQEKNELVGVNAAEHIQKLLQLHNDKFKEKISFGIGINSGEIINKVAEGKLQFTAIGNFIGIAKRLAQSSKGDVLLTNEIILGGMGKIKGDKIGDGKVYILKGVVDVAKNEKFLKGFIERVRD